jgi:isopenicillin N synthase-like dioxygenase
MVVNLGEVLEFISGGLLPATRHRGAFGSHGDQAGTDVQ